MKKVAVQWAETVWVSRTNPASLRSCMLNVEGCGWSGRNLEVYIHGSRKIFDAKLRTFRRSLVVNSTTGEDADELMTVSRGRNKQEGRLRRSRCQKNWLGLVNEPIIEYSKVSKGLLTMLNYIKWPIIEVQKLVLRVPKSWIVLRIQSGFYCCLCHVLPITYCIMNFSRKKPVWGIHSRS